MENGVTLLQISQRMVMQWKTKLAAISANGSIKML